MGDLEVRIRHGGGGNNVAAVGAVVGCVAVCVAAVETARAVASIPVWVIAAIPVAIVAATALGLRALLRGNCRQAADATALYEARCAEWEAAEEAAAEARHQRRLALEAARAPVIHNHIWPSAEAAIAASHAYAPATVITAAQEIQGRSAR
jgi:hypothetical protein